MLILRSFIPFAYLLAAIVNIAPAIGALSDEIVVQLYAVQIHSTEISLLLRHRAVLFAIIGGLLLAAAVMEDLRTTAGLAGLSSMSAFMLLLVVTGAENARLTQVALIDSAATLVLLTAFVAHLKSTQRVRN